MASKILLLCLLQAFVAHASLPLEMFQRRQASPPAACTFIDEALSFCSSVSPGFLDFSPNSQAPCLCYSISGTTTSWEPGVFDGAVVTCANYIKTAEPTAYATFEALEDFCTSVGNVLQQATPGPQTTPVQTSPPTTSQTLSKVPTTTTSAAAGLNFPPCTTVGSLIESCTSATQGFTDLPSQQQASCLCYSGNKLNPNVFDSPMLSCANYLQTADPSDYSSVSVLVGFCTEYAAGANSQSPSQAATVTTTPNIFVSTQTATANGQMIVTKTPGSGSSLQGSVFRNLFSALAAVALDMLLIF